jgi:hypothetical protein
VTGKPAKKPASAPIADLKGIERGAPEVLTEVRLGRIAEPVRRSDTERKIARIRKLRDT